MLILWWYLYYQREKQKLRIITHLILKLIINTAALKMLMVFLLEFQDISFLFDTHISTSIGVPNQNTFSEGILSACPHFLSLIHYQWGCSRKCCLITSHPGLVLAVAGAFKATCLPLNIFFQLSTIIVTNTGKSFLGWILLLSAWPRFDCSCSVSQWEDPVVEVYLLVCLFCLSCEHNLHLNMLY